jgi:serine/threonine protein kinase
MVQGPRVAALVTAARDNETPRWFASEYIQGVTLSEYVQDEGPLDSPMTAALGVLLAEALEEIHSAGITHRDLKPGNIVLGADGPRVIDFGLAVLKDAQGDITKTTDLIGTPEYMAPEQIRAPKKVTPAIDIYALGAVLVFAATSHHVYDETTRAAMVFAIADPGIEPDISGLPDQLAEPVRAMLAFDPSERPSLAEITQALAGRLADHGTSVARAQRDLAALTYIKRPTDPPLPDPPPQASPARMTGDPHVPKDLVTRIAENLRRTYAREAAF